MSAVHLRGKKTPAKPDSDPIKRKPPAPKHLSPFAVAEWDRVLPMLVQRELICRADLGMVEAYCVARGLVVELEYRRRQKGLDSKEMLAMLRQQDKASLTAARLSASLGLDPSSRARLLNEAAQGDGEYGPNPLDF